MTLPRSVSSLCATSHGGESERSPMVTNKLPSRPIAMRPPVLPPRRLDGMAGRARKMTATSINAPFASSRRARATFVLLSVPPTKSKKVKKIRWLLAKPGSITPHTQFKANVYVLTKEEGGRHTPFFTNYRPQFYMRTTDVTGAVTLPEGVEMCMPGDNVEMGIELITPIAIEEGLRFAIREGGRTVGAGVVTQVTK